jgi:hypothetical protein
VHGGREQGSQVRDVIQGVDVEDGFLDRLLALG